MVGATASLVKLLNPWLPGSGSCGSIQSGTDICLINSVIPISYFEAPGQHSSCCTLSLILITTTSLID